MAEEQVNGQVRVRQIGSARVDFDALTISGPEGSTTLEPKVMEVLQSLIAAAPMVVSRETLLERVWGGESGGDESLSRAISLLRKAFGDRRGRHRHIETIPRRGYRLVAELDGPAAGDGLEQDRGGRQRWGVRWMTIPVLGFLLGLAVWYAFAPEEVPPPEFARFSNDRSIAVLPFSDLSPAGDQAYFADGLAEEILNALTSIPELKVAGRTSAFAYRDSDVDIQTLGEELGVRNVLEGSVRKQGDEIRITAQLVRTDNGYQLWSRSFDGSLDRMFDFQEQIARDIASALEVSLSPAGSSRLAPALTDSQAAYDAFLQGRSLARRFGAAEKIRATELLEQAVSIDPGFALAWAELARTEMFVPVSNPDFRVEPHVTRARQAVSRALAIDPDLAMGHFAQGLIQEFELDYAAAMQSFATAHRQEPRNPFLTIRYGYYLALLGQSEVGAELMEQGLRLDPTDAAGIANFAGVKLAAGDFEEAERLVQRSYDLGFSPIGSLLAMLLARRGQQEEAMNVWREYGEDVPGRYLPELESAEGWEAFGQAVLADDPEMRARIAEAFSDYFSDPDARANTYRLYSLVLLGQPGEAMRLFLERPYPINAGFVFAIWGDLHGFAEMRRHPEFPRFVEQIGLVEAWDVYGWPPNCRRVPRLSEDAPDFACD